MKTSCLRVHLPMTTRWEREGNAPPSPALPPLVPHGEREKGLSALREHRVPDLVPSTTPWKCEEKMPPSPTLPPLVPRGERENGASALRVHGAPALRFATRCVTCLFAALTFPGLLTAQSSTNSQVVGADTFVSSGEPGVNFGIRGAAEIAAPTASQPRTE